MSRYISAEELKSKWEILDIDLYDLIRFHGLQPFNNLGEEIMHPELKGYR